MSPRDVACPYCKAAPGEPCKVSDAWYAIIGVVSGTPHHMSRVVEAEIQSEKSAA